VWFFPNRNLTLQKPRNPYKIVVFPIKGTKNEEMRVFYRQRIVFRVNCYPHEYKMPHITEKGLFAA